jgi:hypothetical protein
VRAASGVTHADAEDHAADAFTITTTYARDAVVTEAAESIVGALVGAGLFVREVIPRAASLEQVFAELTRREEEFVADEAPGEDET